MWHHGVSGRFFKSSKLRWWGVRTCLADTSHRGSLRLSSGGIWKASPHLGLVVVLLKPFLTLVFAAHADISRYNDSLWIYKFPSILLLSCWTGASGDITSMKRWPLCNNGKDCVAKSSIAGDGFPRDRARSVTLHWNLTCYCSVCWIRSPDSSLRSPPASVSL